MVRFRWAQYRCRGMRDGDRGKGTAVGNARSVEVHWMVPRVRWHQPLGGRIRTKPAVNVAGLSAQRDPEQLARRIIGHHRRKPIDSRNRQRAFSFGPAGNLELWHLRVQHRPATLRPDVPEHHSRIQGVVESQHPGSICGSHLAIE